MFTHENQTLNSETKGLSLQKILKIAAITQLNVDGSVESLGKTEEWGKVYKGVDALYRAQYFSTLLQQSEY